MSEADRVTRGSGNVFADLGFADAEERLLKSELALRIERTVKRRRLTEAAAAGLLGIDQSDVARLLAGKLTGFSVEQLLHFLAALGHDIEIVVRARGRQPRGRLSVAAE